MNEWRATAPEAVGCDAVDEPAGLAAALALLRIGWDVALYERYAEVKAAGNILNLWPQPQKALRAIGVDIEDLGAPPSRSYAAMTAGLPLAQWSKGRVTIIGDAAGDGYPSQDGLTFGSQAELAVYNVLVELQRDFPVRNAFAVLPLPGARLRDTAVRTPDFVVIGNGRAVVIEVDGPHHSGRNRRADDADRDLHWRRCGVATIRIASEHASDPRSLKARLEEELKRDLRAT